MQAQLAPLNVPATAGAAARIVRDITAFRRENDHDRDLMTVLLSDGNLPANWPNDFNRAMLYGGPIGVVDQLLASDGLPNAAAAGNAKS